MGTTNSNFLPNSTGQDLGATNQRWDLFAQELDSAFVNGVIFANALSSLSAAVAAAGSSGTVIVPPNTSIYNVTNNLNVPAGVSLMVAAGATINIANGVTLTVNGSLQAPPVQIFTLTGTGAVSIVGQSPVWANWFPGADIGAQTNAAFTAAPAAIVEIAPGTYTNITNTITIPGGVPGGGLRLVGNPTLMFAFAGTESAIQNDTNPNGKNLLTGQGTIDMQLTGGTVFKVCGGGDFTFGPADGVIIVKNPTGNIIDVGPGSNLESMWNWVVRGFSVMSRIPGDFVQIITNNYGGPQNAAPFIFAGLIERLFNTSDGTANTGIVGHPVVINANALGPELNVNCIEVARCYFQAEPSNTNSYLFVQSSLSTGSGNSISINFHDCSFGRLTADAGFFADVDSVTTAQAIWGITFKDCASFWHSSTNQFSPTLMANVIPTGHLGVSGFLATFDNYREIAQLDMFDVTPAAATPHKFFDVNTGSLRIRDSANANTLLSLADSGALTVAGKLSSYDGIGTVGNGIPSEVATVDLTGQTAAIGTTTLYAVPASGAGQYRVSWNMKVTTAATGAATSTLGPLTITYTDPDNQAIVFNVPASINTGTIATTLTTNAINSTGVLMGTSVLLNCKASTNIQYATGYASNAANTMAYNLHIKLEAL